MRQQPIIITLGIVQIIILTLFGLYFYRLTHNSDHSKSPVMMNGSSAVEAR